VGLIYTLEHPFFIQIMAKFTLIAFSKLNHGSMYLKQILLKILPFSCLVRIQNFRHTFQIAKFKKLSTQQLFEKIYETDAWGKSNDPLQPYFSGSGSHTSEIVAPYLKAVEDFLGEFEKKPNVVDLGCGDFSIGSKLRQLCDNYIACDIVPQLIDFNKTQFASLGVDFRVLDLTKEELPTAEIVFIRQVLQHLSNKQIAQALPQLCLKYKYMVLTEHLPKQSDFQHNLDLSVGKEIRLQFNSGIVLTSPPFNMKVKMQKKVCEAPENGGLIVTTIYEL
jgi:2-polyprenyl-3-methyl-5-hydroxy-6-metoxy-1,4-benzoquinol methylase